MRSTIVLAAALALSACEADPEDSAPCDAEPAPALGAPVDLFDGATLTGWDGDPIVWRVEDGELVGSATPYTVAHNTFLIATSRTYADFVLTAEVQLVGGRGNTGIQYRSTILDASEWIVGGYQADATDGRWGSIYEERLGRSDLVYTSEACLDAARPDDWNRYEITAIGCRLTHRLNGVLCAEFGEGDPSRPRAGHIALQYHAPGGFEVRYRAIQVAEPAIP